MVNKTHVEAGSGRLASDGRHRRHLLRLLSVLCVHPSLAWSGPPRETPASLLFELFSDVGSAARIGTACQAYYGADVSVEWAVGIWKMLNGGGFTNSSDCRMQTTKHIREDFTQGRTLTVDGWVLSRTEAALCILAATTLHS